MIAYLLASLATAIGQLFELFGITFALAWALYHVSMGMRRLGAERLGLGYFFAVAPGVACHETGHALGCLLTGKKIVEFVPFRPQVEGDGVTLGYVRHASSPSILSRAGEFVVATGPVWFGGIVVLCIVRLLVGAAPFESLAGSNQTPTSFFHYLGSVMEAASSLASRAFALWHWHGVFDVVLVYLLVCVASEITLSGPDLRECGSVSRRFAPSSSSATCCRFSTPCWKRECRAFGRGCFLSMRRWPSRWRSTFASMRFIGRPTRRSRRKRTTVKGSEK